MRLRAPQTVGIVGGGLAGLTAGAFLARAGWAVDVFDKADRPGGCASDYDLGDCRFPTGATLVFGMESRGALRTLLEELNITVPVHLLRHPLDVVLHDRVVGIYADVSAQQAEWVARFPTIAPAVSRLMRHVRIMADAVYALAQTRTRWPVRSLGDAWSAAAALWDHPQSWFSLLWYFAKPWRAVLAAHHLDGADSAEKVAFQQMLDGLLIDSIQTTGQDASALMAAVALDMYRRGSFRVPGGLKPVAQALAERIEEEGGAIHYRTVVRNCQWSRATGQWAVSAGPGAPQQFSRLINATGRPLPSRPDGILRLPSASPPGPHELGAFRIDGVISRRSLPAAIVRDLPRSFQILLPPDPQCLQYLQGAVYLSFHRGLCAGPADILWTASAHTEIRHWQPRMAKAAYRAQKQEVARCLAAACERVIPHLRELSSQFHIATPATYYRFLHKFAVGGVPLTAAGFRKLPGSFTRQPHLYQAGDTVFPGPGILSASLSGFLAARAIAGRRIHQR